LADKSAKPNSGDESPHSKAPAAHHAEFSSKHTKTEPESKPITKPFKQQINHESQETPETNQVKIKNS
jgi:hypothetical protein